MIRNWKIVKWSEALTIINGKNQKQVLDNNGCYPIYGSGGVMGYANDYLCEENTVVIGRKGSINNPIFVREKFWNVDTAFGLSAKRELLEPKYLYYFCTQFDFDRLNTTVTIPSLTKARLLNIELPLPPLAEQRRIAEVLDKAEALRAKRRAALAELDSLTQSIFLDLFGDPTSQTQRFPIQPLETILQQSLQNGAYYPKESYTEVGGVEMVHMSDAFNEVVPRGKLKRVICSKTDLEKYALSEFDILIARRSLTIEGAAKPCLIPKSSEPLIFESSFIRVTPHPAKLTALYLYHYLGNERVKQKCVQPYITQSTISGINQSNLERVPVIVPPLSLQREFARRVEVVEKLKRAQRASLAELDALFATLQHRAFRGEL